MSNEVAGLRYAMATALAPLVAVGIYGLVILVDLGHWPRPGEAWLGWVIAGVAVAAYVLTLLATAVLLIFKRKLSPRSPWTFGTFGLIAGLGLAALADLPSLNIARIAYYALAGTTGGSRRG
jgi:hypothetical protein